MVSVSAGGNVLATYTYASGNGKLTRLTYGNGDYEDYTYDNLDRLAKVTYNGSTTDVFTVLYDSNGRLAKAVDGKVGITYLYEYDSLDRLIRAYQKDSSGNTVYAVENSYDSYGRPTGSTYVIDGVSRTYSIAYKANTNLVSQYNTPGASFSYNYDSFDRLTSKTGTPFNVAYTYTPNSTQVASVTVTTASNATLAYTHTYDALGNITSVSLNGTLVASYEYDALGQLIRENNVSADTTYLFTYDKAGNILTKHQYAYSTDTTANLLNTTGQVTSYTYGNSAWGDLLTKHGSTSISYDEIGNPLNWRGFIDLTWDERSLKSLGLNYGGGVTFDMSFEYNSDGIRTQKTVVDTSTSENYTVKYVLDGSKILRETHINNTTGAVVYTMDFMYDDSGVAGFIYNGTSYYYIKNLQGDILYICNASGNIVVEYTYDAWGNILSTTGSMVGTIGKYNPFRYRGYYYDSEIALYYLNSRFYDPQVGRFINADGIVGANGGLQGYNMFAYCNNNPVAYNDFSGYVAKNVLTRDDGFGNSGVGKQEITNVGKIKTQKAITNQGIVFIYYPDEHEFSVDKYDYYKVKLTMPDDTYIFLNLTSEKLYVEELPYNIDFVSTAATNSYSLLWDSQVMIMVVYKHHDFASNTNQHSNNWNGGWYSSDDIDVMTSSIQTMFKLGQVPGMMCRNWDSEAAWDILTRKNPFDR